MEVVVVVWAGSDMVLAMAIVNGLEVFLFQMGIGSRYSHSARSHSDSHFTLCCGLEYNVGIYSVLSIRETPVITSTVLKLKLRWLSLPDTVLSVQFQICKLFVFYYLSTVEYFLDSFCRLWAVSFYNFLLLRLCEFMSLQYCVLQYCVVRGQYCVLYFQQVVVPHACSLLWHHLEE